MATTPRDQSESSQNERTEQENSGEGTSAQETSAQAASPPRNKLSTLIRRLIEPTPPPQSPQLPSVSMSSIPERAPPVLPPPPEIRALLDDLRQQFQEMATWARQQLPVKVFSRPGYGVPFSYSELDQIRNQATTQAPQRAQEIAQNVIQNNRQEWENAFRDYQTEVEKYQEEMEKRLQDLQSTWQHRFEDYSSLVNKCIEQHHFQWNSFYENYLSLVEQYRAEIERKMKSVLKKELGKLIIQLNELTMSLPDDEDETPSPTESPRSPPQ